jgi:tetratricopeptide (TPR) repeat protein
MVSKFNPLFNGEQALLKAEQTLNKQHKDNFDKILPVFRLGDEDQVSNVKPDLERAIEKGSKVIQTHSMLIRNEQKNKFIDDSYILVGKSRFYQKDYLRSLETFNYVMLQYAKGDDVFEAKLWAARCKTQLNNYLSAKEDFEKIYRHKDLPKNLKGDTYASYAQLEINQKRYTPAYQLLQQAIEKSRSKKKRIRWLFICGQLQSKMGNDFEASEIFLQVIKKGPPYELLFQAQLNRARNYDIELQDPTKAFDELKDMLKDDKNFDNRDQIYYVMAEIAEKLEEYELMEKYLKQSVKAFTINNKQKALSYLKLAEYNFKERRYPPAEAYFDSTFKSLDSQDPRYLVIKKRKESLNNLITNLNIIEDQDSLQKLAGMSEEDRLEVIEDYIFKLKEEEEAQKLREQQAQFASSGNSSGEGAIASAGKWYFYNSSLRGTGIRDFTNTFGNRKLEDNWRRKNKQTLTDFQVSSEEEADSTAAEPVEDSEKYKVETYLKNIPLTPEALEASHARIVQAYQVAGRIYKDELDDRKAAIKALEELLERYTDFDEKTRVWYSLYRICLTLKKNEKANYYKNLILTQDAESEYAALINNANSGDGDKNEAEVAYSNAYNEYHEHHYPTSLSLAETGMKQFSETDFLPKFHLLKAFSLVGMGKKEAFIEQLKLEVDLYPGTEEAKEAQAILEQIDPGSSETPKPEDADEEPKVKTNYTFKKAAQHKYVVIVPNEGGKVNDLRVKLTDFNKKFFSIDNLRTKSFLLNKDYQMITISNFNNSQRALDYYRNIISQKTVAPFSKGPEIQHFVISSDNFPQFYNSKNVGEYMKYFQENYLK